MYVVKPNINHLSYKNKKSNIISIQLIILGFLLFHHLLFLSKNITTENAIYISCILFLFNTIWSLWSWYYLTKTFFTPYVLFFSAAVIFNGGQVLLEIFDLNVSSVFLSIFKGDFSKDIIYSTVIYTLLGLNIFHLGGLLSISKDKIKYRNYRQSELVRNVVFNIGLFLFIISIIPTLFILKEAINIVLTFGYSGIHQREMETSFAAAPLILTNYLSTAIIFLLIGSKGKKVWLIFLSLMMANLVLILFFLGDRSGAILPLVAFVWVWHKVIHPIPKKLLISSALILVFIFFPLISFTRKLSGIYRLDINFLIEAFFSIENPIVSIISEMGSSMATLTYTIELVPELKSFELGSSYFYAAYSIIPNYFSDIHPAKVHGTPSDWITQTIFPDFASKGGGLGYSFIAESYLNFGWIFGFLVLGLHGFFIGKLDSFSSNINKFENIAFTASFMVFLLKYARADMFSVIRPLIWYSLIPYLMIFIYTHFKNLIKGNFFTYIHLKKHTL